MRYRLVVFDIDGTIIDSVSALDATLRFLLEDAGMPEPDPELLREAIGMPGDRALFHLGLPTGEEAVQRMLTVFLERQDLVRVFQGIPELLDALVDNGCMLGIVTAQSRSEMQKLFAPFGLLDRFRYVVNSDEVEFHKPAPDQLLECQRRAGVSPEETLYVGDTEVDAACAEAANTDFALACWGGYRLCDSEHCIGIFRSPEGLLGYCLR